MAISVGCGSRKKTALPRNLVGALTLLAVSLSQYGSVEGEPAIVTLNAARSCQRSVAGCCYKISKKVKAAVPFVPPPVTTVRTRLSVETAFSDPEYLAKYTRAYGLLRKRGWADQVTAHCVYTNDDSLGLNPHNSWLFLPWHRWYLYFHERLLQKLLNDPTFMLPFWNWDSDTTKRIFPPYTIKGSPLFNKYRNNNSTLLESQLIDGTSSEQMVRCVVDADDTSSFFGEALPDGGSSLMEASVHGIVHMAIGQQRAPFIDMGNLSRASNDALFFVHHNNVDRLWWLWNRLPADANGQDRSPPTDPDWLNSQFLLYDENGVLRSMTVADCVDTTRLGYTFEDVANPWLPANVTLKPPPVAPIPPPVTTKPPPVTSKPPPVTPKLPPVTPPTKPTSPPNKYQYQYQYHYRRRLHQTPPAQNSTASDSGPFTITNDPTTVTLALVSGEQREPYMEDGSVFMPMRMSPSGTVVQEGSGNSEVLVIENLQLFSNGPAMFSVHVDNPDATMTSPSVASLGYLGYWFNLPYGSLPTSERPPPKSIQIPLHNFLLRQGKIKARTLSITIVPYYLDPNTGEPTQFASSSVASVGNMEIVYR